MSHNSNPRLIRAAVYAIACTCAIGAPVLSHAGIPTPIEFSNEPSSDNLVGSLDFGSNGSIGNYNFYSTLGDVAFNNSNSSDSIDYNDGGYTTLTFTLTASSGTTLFLNLNGSTASPTFETLNTGTQAAFATALQSIPSGNSFVVEGPSCELAGRPFCPPGTSYLMLAGGGGANLLGGYFEYSDPPSGFQFSLTATPFSTSTTPPSVPEPVAISLFGAGLGLLSLRRRRQPAC
jgi:hypothetical protein